MLPNVRLDASQNLEGFIEPCGHRGMEESVILPVIVVNKNCIVLQADYKAIINHEPKKACTGRDRKDTNYRYQSAESGIPGLTTTSSPSSGTARRAACTVVPGSGQSRRIPLTCPVD